MDIFTEQIVRKRKTFGEVFLQMSLWVFGVAIGLWLLAFTYLNYHVAFTLVTMLVLAMWVGVFFLSRSMNIEYEYAVTNGAVDVDKIIAKSRRKRLVSFDCEQVESVGLYRAERFTGRSFDKRLNVCSGKPSDKVYYLTLHHTELGHVLLVFTPNERVVEALKSSVSRQVRQDAEWE